MNDLHPLGKLIQSIQDENGWNDVDLANRAVDRGHETSKQSIGLYKKKDVVSITARQVHLLADALGVKPMTVLRAAAESMGVQDQQESTGGLADVVRTTTELSERDKRLVMSLIDAMRTDESSEHGTDTQPQDDHPPIRAISGEDHEQEDPGIEQKMGSGSQRLDFETLAAHHDFRTASEDFEDHFGDVGEESQDPDRA